MVTNREAHKLRPVCSFASNYHKAGNRLPKQDHHSLYDLLKYYYGIQINENEMSGAYSMHGTDSKCVHMFGRHT